MLHHQWSTEVGELRVAPAMAAVARTGHGLSRRIVAPDRNGTASPRKCVSHAEPNPAVAARDDRNAPGQIKVAHKLPLPFPKPWSTKIAGIRLRSTPRLSPADSVEALLYCGEAFVD